MFHHSRRICLRTQLELRRATWPPAVGSSRATLRDASNDSAERSRGMSHITAPVLLGYGSRPCTIRPLPAVLRAMLAYYVRHVHEALPLPPQFSGCTSCSAPYDNPVYGQPIPGIQRRDSACISTQAHLCAVGRGRSAQRLRGRYSCSEDIASGQGIPRLNRLSSSALIVLLPGRQGYRLFTKSS